MLEAEPPKIYLELIGATNSRNQFKIDRRWFPFEHGLMWIACSDGSYNSHCAYDST